MTLFIGAVICKDHKDPLHHRQTGVTSLYKAGVSHYNFQYRIIYSHSE